MVLAIIALFADVRDARLQEDRSPRAHRGSEATRGSDAWRFAAAVFALSAGGIAAGPALTGESANPRAPPGFAVVKARGRVAHAVIQYSSSVRLTSLARQDRPTKTIEEVWYDARGGLWRDVVRIDGRVRRDRSGT
jgi:hypothetical protein